MFGAGLAVGLVVGFLVGFVLLACLIAASRGDDAMERKGYSPPPSDTPLPKKPPPRPPFHECN